MAGESSANISRSSTNSSDSAETEPPDRKSPNFLTEETQFVGKGNRRSSTPLGAKNRRSRSVSGSRITPSVLSLSDERFYEDLEDYVKEMSVKRDTMDAGAEPDVWSQLQQKESDLLLAAELGKALLDKNEELKKEQERISEEYSKKLEELEQEKHLLRRRLDTTQGEYEARLLELQNDIKELTAKIGSKDNCVKQRDEEKANLIAELTAQNSRLTTQLKESSITEAQLLAQLEGLKDQCSMRKNSLQDHVQSLKSLKAELALVSDKKADLERRLTASLRDKDNLSQQLDEANDRIAAIERQLKEQEHLYQNTLKELERLQRSHDTLAERVGAPDAVYQSDTARSLHAEMETEPEDEDDSWLRSEAVQVFKELRSLALQLNTGHDDDSGLHSDLSISSLDGEEGETLRRGALAAACADAVAAYATLEGSRVRDSIAAHARRAMERERQIDEKNEIIADLSSKLSVAEVELRAAAEERDKLLNDSNYNSLQNDEAVSRARQERDEAIERKKAAEVALAKTRVELMQANSQLYEAVRQKVDLGQQLEQWQMDMQELIDEQMKHKLTTQEKRRKIPEPIAPTRKSRLLGFFSAVICCTQLLVRLIYEAIDQTTITLLYLQLIKQYDPNLYPAVITLSTVCLYKKDAASILHASAILLLQLNAFSFAACVGLFLILFSKPLDVYTLAVIVSVLMRSFIVTLNIIFNVFTEVAVEY